MNVSSSIATALDDIALVVSCIDQPGRNPLHAAIERGLRYTDITPHLCELGRGAAYEKLDAAARTFRSACGVGHRDRPGIANGMVRAVAETLGGDIAMESAQVTLVKGDLNGIVRARILSRATVRDIWQNLAFGFSYNALGISIAAGALYPVTGLLLSPLIAALAMSLSSISVITNALRLRYVRA